jgi:hypothetical protein
MYQAKAATYILYTYPYMQPKMATKGATAHLLLVAHACFVPHWRPSQQDNAADACCLCHGHHSCHVLSILSYRHMLPLTGRSSSSTTTTNGKYRCSSNGDVS